MVTTLLTKSKKAVIMYPGDGSVYITSVAYLRMLIDGKANGNLMVWKQLKSADDNNDFGNLDKQSAKKNESKGFDFESL